MFKLRVKLFLNLYVSIGIHGLLFKIHKVSKSWIGHKAWSEINYFDRYSGLKQKWDTFKQSYFALEVSLCLVTICWPGFCWVMLAIAYELVRKDLNSKTFSPKIFFIWLSTFRLLLKRNKFDSVRLLVFFHSYTLLKKIICLYLYYCGPTNQNRIKNC